MKIIYYSKPQCKNQRIVISVKYKELIIIYLYTFESSTNNIKFLITPFSQWKRNQHDEVPSN